MFHGQEDSPAPDSVAARLGGLAVSGRQGEMRSAAIATPAPRVARIRVGRLCIMDSPSVGTSRYRVRVANACHESPNLPGRVPVGQGRRTSEVPC